MRTRLDPEPGSAQVCGSQGGESSSQGGDGIWFADRVFDGRQDTGSEHK